jgi:16S rRNA (guanine527-N7)-methyltransferase
VSDDDRLLATLGRARELGFLGPGPLEPHLRHACGFAALIRGRTPNPDRILDLGTGGGVPGLVLAEEFPDAAIVLLEASTRRAEFLVREVAARSWSARVQVVNQRGEAAAANPDLRDQFPAVTARGFAEPAVTAEIASGFLRIGGVLVVSEPPMPAEGRWPIDGLTGLGLSGATNHEVNAAHFVVIEKIAASPTGYPRSTGRPSKRPLW